VITSRSRFLTVPFARAIFATLFYRISYYAEYGISADATGCRRDGSRTRDYDLSRARARAAAFIYSRTSGINRANADEPNKEFPFALRRAYRISLSAGGTNEYYDMMIRYVIVIPRRPHRDRHLMSRCGALAPSKESAPRDDADQRRERVYIRVIYTRPVAVATGEAFRSNKPSPMRGDDSPLAIYDHGLVRASERAGTRSFASDSSEPLGHACLRG